MATFKGWQGALLKQLGAPATRANLKFLNAWAQAEGGSASYNPFNTTQGASGASDYNSVGVKNYGSPGQGIHATAQTLLNGRYNPIVSGLRSGHATATQLATEVAHSPWGTGSGVLRVLGSGPVPIQAGSSAPLQALHRLTGGGGGGNSPASLLSSFLLQEAQAQLSGQNSVAQQGQGLLQLAMARKALGAAASNPMTARRSTKAGASASGPVGNFSSNPSAYSNILTTGGVNISRVDPKLLGAINQVAKAHGVKVTINSGWRSPQHSVAVGGFANDPHTKGLAVDAYVNGRPIGSVFGPGIWSALGVTSGAVPGFYHGSSDPEHLQIG